MIRVRQSLLFLIYAASLETGKQHIFILWFENSRDRTQDLPHAGRACRIQDLPHAG